MWADMRQRHSISVESSECAVPKPLIALVSLLARQAAREFVTQASASDSKRDLKPMIREDGVRDN
jgi:hypothetical protein